MFFVLLKKKNKSLIFFPTADYSLQGPAELNLTEKEIEKLALPAPEEPNTKSWKKSNLRVRYT